MDQYMGSRAGEPADDDELAAMAEEALADEALRAEPPTPVPGSRCIKRVALAVVLAHHRPRAGETWDDVLDGARARDLADAVWIYHGFDQAGRMPFDHGDLWDAAGFLLARAEWADLLLSTLLVDRRRFLHPEGRDLR